MTEAQIQRAVIDQLKERAVLNSVWFHVPNNRGSRRHSGFTAGVSDLILLHNGEAFALELKKATGGRVSEAQLEFKSKWDAAGGFSCIAEGYEQAIRSLELWGLLRGRS